MCEVAAVELLEFFDWTQFMKMNTPTIEALDAAFSEHYESLTRQDRLEQITWFLEAIDDSKLLRREI